MNNNCDLRDARWLSVDFNKRQYQENPLEFLVGKVQGKKRVILKPRIQVENGPDAGDVSYEVKKLIKRSDQKVLQQFIKQHTRKSLNHTVELYTGFCSDWDDLYDQVDYLFRAGMLRKITMDAAAKPERRGDSMNMIRIFADGRTQIGVEPIVLDSGDVWTPSFSTTPQIMAFRHWHKYGRKLVVEKGREVIVYVRYYPHDNDVPDPTSRDIDQMQNHGLVLAYTHATAIKLDLEESDDE